MNYFEEYRKAYDEMQADEELTNAGVEVELAVLKLKELETPHKERISQAEEGIKETVLDQQRTMVLNGIEATYSKPRKSRAGRVLL